MSIHANDLDRFGTARVLVIGDVMLDRFVYGDVQRISPEAPIPVMRAERDMLMAGGAGNVARNIAALGASVTLVGVVGNDSAANDLRTALAQPRISARLIVSAQRPTAEKTRFISGRQQLLRVDRETGDPLAAAAEAEIVQVALDCLAEADVVVLSDYAKGVLGDAVLGKIIPAAAAAGKPVLVDPKGQDYRRYRGASLITPNQKEAALASGMPCDTDEDVEAAARHLMRDCGLQQVLVTRGPAGMSLVRATAGPLHLAAEAREVFDVSGAGDTVAAALAVALAAGFDLPRAVQVANAAAGIVVGKIGTAVVLPDELRAALHMPDPHGLEAKVMTLPALQAAAGRWRARGERIGFTNGCFDLLHAGHLALLAEARGLCDRLVVAINADASVRKLKGPDRPVQDETHRARLLAALAMVDAVIIFSEDTPEPLLHALRPDLLIKGGDYGIDGVVGADIVRAYGGEVRVSGLVKGQSTTATIKKLRG